MKHRYSFKLLAAFLFILAANTTFGQSVQVRANQSLVDGNTKLRIEFSLRNVSGAPLALGRTDILFSINDGALNNEAFVKDATADGIWDDNNNPRFYEDIRFPYIQSNNQIFLSVRRTIIDTTVAVATIDNGQSAVLAAITVPIRDCQGFSNLTFNAVNSSIRNFNGEVLTAGYTNGTIGLAAPAPNVIFNQESGPVPAEPFRYCSDQSVALTAVGVGVQQYRFYKLPAGTPLSDTVALTNWQSSGSFNLALNRILNGDSVIVFVRTATCTYKVARGAYFEIDRPYTEAPTPTDPSTANNILCVNSTNGTFAINPIPGALSYQWSVDRPQAGNFVGTPTGTNAQFDWNNSYVGPVRIRVRAINTCGLGRGTEFQFFTRIDAGRPATPALPEAASPVTQPVCINANALTQFTVPAGRFAYEYVWGVSPSNAVNSFSVNTSSDTNTSSRSITINWNRNYTGSNVRISVAAENSCGRSDSSTLILQVQPLPNKPLRIVSSITNNTLCEGDTNEVTFTMVAAPGATPIAATNGYRWSFRVSPNALNQLYPGNPNTVLARSVNPVFSTDVPTITVRASQDFFGYYQVVGAVAGANCDGDDFIAQTYGLDGGFQDPRSTSLSDTVSLDFFMSPKPRRDFAEAPSGARAICRSAGSDTARFVYTPSRYATRYRWSVIQVAGGPDPSLLGNFLATDTSLNSNLVISPSAPNGDYFIRVTTSNSCGAGDTSSLLRIRLSTAPATKIDSIFVFYANNNLSIDSAQRGGTDRRFCKNNNETTQLFALAKYDNSVFDTVSSSSPTALFYRWEVRNGSGALIPGVIIRGVNSADLGAGVGKLGTASGGIISSNPYPSVFKRTAERLTERGAQFRDDSSVVHITLPAGYTGPFSIISSPVNGCNIGSLSLQQDSSITFRGGLFVRPLTYPGRSTDNASRIPVGTPYKIGGGPAVNAPLPTVTVFNGSIRSSDFTWTVNTPSTGNLDITDSINPVFTSTSAGPQTIALKVVDSLGCGSIGGNNITITSFDSYNVSLKVLLEGPSNATATLMHDSLYNTLDFANGNERAVAVRYERRDLAAAVLTTRPTFIPGVRFPSTPGNQIVDFITIELYREGNTNPITANVIAQGYAFLKQDGSIVDPYTGTLPYASLVKVTSSAIAPSEAFYVRVRHRNHLPIFSDGSSLVTPQINGAPGNTNVTGFVDLTVPNNVYREVRNVNGSNINIVNGKALMIAGNVENGLSGPNSRFSLSEINSHDIKMVSDAMVTIVAPAAKNYFMNQDTNLSGTVNTADYLITLRNASQLLFTTNP
jgi:hypothetical protein